MWNDPSLVLSLSCPHFPLETQRPCFYPLLSHLHHHNCPVQMILLVRVMKDNRAQTGDGLGALCETGNGLEKQQVRDNLLK